MTTWKNLSLKEGVGVAYLTDKRICLEAAIVGWNRSDFLDLEILITVQAMRTTFQDELYLVKYSYLECQKDPRVLPLIVEATRKLKVELKRYPEQKQ